MAAGALHASSRLGRAGSDLADALRCIRCEAPGHTEIATQDKETLEPIGGRRTSLRDRLDLKGELVLAALPTATILIVLALVEVLTEQRLLFASLASSAFLIYLDPEHGTNAVRTLVLAHLTAASAGFALFLLAGPGYMAGAAAMVTTIILMIVLDAVHPPAVSTAMSFALRAGDQSNLVLFFLALGITAVLVLLQRAAVWLLARRRSSVPAAAPR